MLQCGDCGENLTLAVDKDTGAFVGYCRKCRRAYEMMATEVEPEELERMRERARPTGMEKDRTLFYLRCTDVLKYQ